METMYNHRFLLLSPLLLVLLLLHGAALVSAQEVCGDGVCGVTENTYWCARDCGGVCGDGLCSRDESFATCQDCSCIETEEEALNRMINEYRNRNGLPSVPLGVGMSRVAQTHARDSSVSTTAVGPCNQHSWSTRFFDNLSWGGCCYTNDNAQATCMFDKPRELSGLGTFGFEISAQGFGSVSAALSGWQQSQVHNDVILNLNTWARFTWLYMGVGVDPQARWFHVWFYDGTDDTVKAKECLVDPSTVTSDTGTTPTPSVSMVSAGNIPIVVDAPTATPTTSSSISPTASMTIIPGASISVSPTMTPSMSAPMSPSPSMSTFVAPTTSPSMSPTPTMTVSPTPTMTVSPTPTMTVSPTVSIGSGNVDAPVPLQFLADGSCNPNFLQVSVVVDPHEQHGGHLLQGHLWTGDLSKVDPQKIISLRPIPYTAFHMISPQGHFNHNGHLFDIVRMSAKNKNSKNKHKNKNKKNKNKNKNHKNKKNKDKSHMNKKNKNKNKEIEKENDQELELELEEELDFKKEKKNKKKRNNEDKAAKVYLQFELCGKRYITVKYYQADSKVYARHVDRKTNVYSGIARDNLRKAVHAVFGHTLTFKSWYHSFIRVELYVDSRFFVQKAVTFKLELTTQ